tara:strand:+ start:198 stop:1295 length:1098 start_codon:yes stop_codon:yes gene_type:complete
MTTIIFTRYLYNADEVRLTFLECLLKAKDLEECYFWIYEYYKSGFQEETWNLIWKIYYDFYALSYPKMERKIKQYYKLWKNDKQFINIMHIIKNLFRFSSGSNSCVFILRIYYHKRLFKLLEEKELKEEIKYNCEHKYQSSLIQSILEKDFENMAYYLKRCIKDTNIIKLLEYAVEKKLILNEYYDNKFHQLLVKIIQNKKDINYRIKYYYKKALQKEFNILTKSDESCRKGRLKDVSYVYTTLKKRRIYSISSKIGCFKLKRENIDLKKMFWYHWEYFAYFSPLWKNRFFKYDICIDHDKKIISFNNVDEEEEFYEEYGYEPDEQSKEIQQKSIREIPDNRLNNWLNELFIGHISEKIITKTLY